MDWKASWIWDDGDPNPWNYWLCARKTFNLNQAPSEAQLHISADTRYVLWVNGERLGGGPVRGWPFAYRYDSYDLRGRLGSGENVIAVLVLHYGVGTFQSLPTRAGLLVQLDADGQALVKTDTTWRLNEMTAHERRTARISCQQAFVEHYDATKEETGWQSAGFDDGGWKRAVEVGTVGCEPWTSLQPRNIPFLTDEPMSPVNVLRAGTVRAPEQVWGLDLRRYLLPGYLEANPKPICGIVATTVRVKHESPVSFHTMWPYLPVRIRINGQDMPREETVWTERLRSYTFRGQLSAGENLILMDFTGHLHEWGFALIVESDPALEPGVPLSGGHPIVVYGPFHNREDSVFQLIWNARTAGDLSPYLAFQKPVEERDIYRDHVFARVAHTREVAPLETRPFAALCGSGENAVEFAPNPLGDTEVLLEFEKMTVGYWEFEVEGPAGAVIDLVGFESIQEGVIDFAWSANIEMRYITRAGRQTFRSFIRRGARYLILTVRNLTAPIRIRNLRTLVNTYPVVERGAFTSNDSRLNQIWKMGQWTTRLCSEDTYVDCPTYEQTFWLGDSRNEGAANHYTFGEYPLSRRCLLLAAESMRRSPVIESQVPSAWEDILSTFCFLWEMACEEYYQITGDHQFVEEVYPAIAKQNAYCLKQRDERGLFKLESWNLLDWAPIDTPRDATCAHLQAWFIIALERQARLAKVLGKSEDIPAIEGTRQSLAAALNRHFWDEEQGAYRDSLHADGTPSPVFSQGTNTVIYLANCAPPEREDRIKQLLADAPEGIVRVGSPFFMFFTFEVLARLGEHRRILDMIHHHWGFMLDQDATTCWEVFPGFEAHGRFTRSHCHAWSAGPTYFLSRYQLGVSPIEPGFKRALIEPIPAGLDWAHGRVPTPHGEISVEWRLQAGFFSIEVRLPPAVSADLRLPGEAGRFTKIEAEGAQAVGAANPLAFRLERGASARIDAQIP